MKTLMRILVVIVFVFLIGFYRNPSIQENDVLENQLTEKPRKEMTPDTSAPAISDGLTRPKSGLSVYIGKDINAYTEQWGEPDRVDAGDYYLDWWIYNRGAEGYMQIGVTNGIIRSVYVMGEGVDVSPYYIGQPIDEIYRFTMINSEVVVESEDGIYQFELSEEDLHTRLLIPFGEVYAQLYIDQYTGKILGVQFLDIETLINQRPYELAYRGDLPEVTIAEQEQQQIDAAYERQIFDMSNIIRLNEGLAPLEWEERIAVIARSHSQKMQEDVFYSRESSTDAALADRLDETMLTYEIAGENIASNYTDAFAVVHAWINSEKHRATMLSDDFTQMGVGVISDYYTQIFIKIENEEEEVLE
ncbi:CAP domain-containing protein [Jeotgalibacillus soli]|uniref:CAP domain-containing protein n=1 Tax=Jeotgalibacillus soli TaxID=889306 RepID=UPI000698B343|nr:CAP domain-containing protein [Jeotgalibacillus soli]